MLEFQIGENRRTVVVSLVQEGRAMDEADDPGDVKDKSRNPEAATAVGIPQGREHPTGFDVPSSLQALFDCVDDSSRLKDLTSAVRKVLDAVQSAGGWPYSQPVRTIQTLARYVIESAGADSSAFSARQQAATEALRLFLTAFAARAHNPLFRNAQLLQVEVLLGLLQSDRLSPVKRLLSGIAGLLRGSPSAKWYPIAYMLVANYSAILDANQRMRLIKLLDSLVSDHPDRYADPYVQNLLILRKAINLDRLESGLVEELPVRKAR